MLLILIIICYLKPYWEAKYYRNTKINWSIAEVIYDNSWVWNTLNQCLRACDVASINAWGTDYNCYYEWVVIIESKTSEVKYIKESDIILKPT